MRIRAFTRLKAYAVRPGQVLEAPKPIDVREVTAKYGGGVRLTGYRPGAKKDDARRINVELHDDDDVEAEVADPAAVDETLRLAFQALARKHQEDDDDTSFSWERLPTGEIRVHHGAIRFVLNTGVGGSVAKAEKKGNVTELKAAK